MDVATVIAGFVANPVAFAFTCRGWAQAVALLGRIVVAGLAGRHPATRLLRGDSYDRVIYYMSVGWAAPNPGKSTSSTDASHPIWPFPIPAAWKTVVHGEYERHDPVLEAGVCKTLWQTPQPISGRDRPPKSGLDVRYGQTHEIDGFVCGYEGDGLTTVFTGLRRLMSPQNDDADTAPSCFEFGPVWALGAVFAVGPFFVALPMATGRKHRANTNAGPLLAVDGRGNALDHQEAGWIDGRQTRMTDMAGSRAPLLRRVSNTCLAVDVTTGRQARYSYCAAVVWWTPARGLRVRQFGQPARCGNHAGWSLPPLDADQHEIPVFVLKWGRDPPLALPQKRAKSREAASGPAKRVRKDRSSSYGVVVAGPR